MEQQVEIVNASSVKAQIARSVLGDPEENVRLGSIDLLPHQASASSRLLSAIREFGGALLADEVGMGKTFIALDVARHFEDCLVVAPAALRDMWVRQSQRAHVPILFHSFESLSRSKRPDSRAAIVIIDEAHHARNPATVRYRELARLLTGRKTLMLSATPVHNSRRDITRLLALFLGSQADAMVENDISRCVIRRTVRYVENVPIFPQVAEPKWKQVEDSSDIPDQLLALPPPVALRDGGLAGVLVQRALLRQWCSSDAALEAALRKRLGRSIALASALESGQYPSETELKAWAYAEDSLQLAFPSLVAAGASSCAQLLEGARDHEAAVRALLAKVGADNSRDIQRAKILKEIRAAHPGVPIVVFTQYAATVNGLFRLLRAEPRVAALTASGARIASGTISRREALMRFAPIASGASPPREIERITILITTDLMSEGVNLQDAGVVVHLDLPWTAARLEQRLGRIRRIESNHTVVHSYGIRPMRSVDLLINLEATVQRKLVEAEWLTGTSIVLLPRQQPAQADDPLTVSERIRAILTRWLAGSSGDQKAEKTIRAAAALSAKSGFIATIEQDSRATLVGFDGENGSESPAKIVELLESIGDESVELPPNDLGAALRSIEGWLSRKRVLGFADEDRAAQAHARSRVLNRISSIAQAAQAHRRQRIHSLANSARQAVLSRLGVAAESEMVKLGSSTLDDETWLETVGQILSDGEVTGAIESTVTALLLLVPGNAARENARR